MKWDELLQHVLRGRLVRHQADPVKRGRIEERPLHQVAGGNRAQPETQGKPLLSCKRPRE